MGLGKKWFLWSQVVIGMLLVQAFATGMQILSRIILVEGTFVFALMTYRHLVAALCVAPLAFYFERVSEVNKCNKNVWFWLFCNALAGLERLNLDTKGGKVKCIGALMCVGGALTTSLYKGKAYYIISHHHHHDHTTNHSHIIPNTTHTNWPLGTLMLVGSCFCYSTWFLIQVKLKQIFPYKYWSTMLTCLIGALQSAIVGLCLDRSVASWRLGWNLQLITIIYSGSLATAATFCLLTWAISIKGATYPSMFNPLTLIFVSLSEAIILGVAITTGTLIGMVLIIFGLYSFLWGNRKETKSLVHDENSLEGEGAIKITMSASDHIPTMPTTPKQ
ncbi:hypothetical protein F8388_006343 [Cannabis sativa]|uniref:WAT1-related protein n=1 Tax=Cannabis sativa TaxID=3483 RepID=A0A7J6EFZ7_CANSA|nr:hypothetical protein F8388_006343 [Cannabis sativa]